MNSNTDENTFTLQRALQKSLYIKIKMVYQTTIDDVLDVIYYDAIKIVLGFRFFSRSKIYGVQSPRGPQDLFRLDHIE